MQLIEALQAAGVEDLAELESQIEETERRLALLKTARKLLQQRLGGTAAAADRGADDLEKFRSDVHDYLQSEGPQKSAAIAQRFGVTSHRIGQLLKGHAWFVQRPDRCWTIKRR